MVIRWKLGGTLNTRTGNRTHAEEQKVVRRWRAADGGILRKLYVGVYAADFNSQNRLVSISRAHFYVLAFWRSQEQ